MFRILAALSLLSVGLPAAALAAEAGFSAAAPCPGCSVILVSFDALQAAHVHALGYPRLTTPTIDRLADIPAIHIDIDAIPGVAGCANNTKYKAVVTICLEYCSPIPFFCSIYMSAI